MSDHEAAHQVLRRARSQLEAPLKLLQGLAKPLDAFARATLFVADAASALYEAQSTLGQNDEVSTRRLRQATEALGQALGLVEAIPRSARLDAVSEGIARALALLYPITQSRVRKRRAVMLGAMGQPDAPLAFVPRAPEPPKTRTSAPPVRSMGHQNRRGTPRAMLEVDIGLLSHSHFYTGLSMDVSKGGLFIATYEPLEVGTLLTLFFVLPSGQAVEAPGKVRWIRAGDAEFPPGMGVAFEALSDDALKAVATFCEQRSPLYHDSADD